MKNCGIEGQTTKYAHMSNETTSRVAIAMHASPCETVPDATYTTLPQWWSSIRCVTNTCPITTP